MATNDKNVVIKLSPLVLKLSPLGFRRYAKEFHRAAESNKSADGYSPVQYYLYCHSIELLFKAHLLNHGVTINELKRFGHNLIKVMREAEKLSIGKLVKITKKEKQNMELANKYYAKKGFEYFYATHAMTGYRDLPKLEVLKKLTEKLIDGLYDDLLENA